MKEIYILLLNLVISMIASIIRMYNLSDNSSSNESIREEKHPINNDRNTLFKLLSLKKKLEMHRNKK